MNAANFAEVSRGGPRMILLIERPGCAFGELERRRIDSHEKIPGTAGNHLTRSTVA